MRKTKKELQRENDILWTAIRDTIWMAIRYAHGRHTYAPSMVRDAVNSLNSIDKDFKLRKDITIETPQHKLKGMDFREDYLDDLFEEKPDNYLNFSMEDE